MGLYEIQVLDSYKTRPMQMVSGPPFTASIAAGQAARPPGQWQVTTSFFMAALRQRWKFLRPARVTVLHNGVLVQDNVELFGPTAHNGASSVFAAATSTCQFARQEW